MLKKVMILFIVYFAIISCNLIPQDFTSEEGNVINISNEDVEMNAAIQKAQETLPIFIEAFLNPKPSQEFFTVKVKIPVGNDGSAEHIWISELSLNNLMFTGTLDNEPVDIKNLSIGDRITVKQSDISDWMIIEQGKILGGFTLHVLRNRMTNSDREKFDSMYGDALPDKPALP